MQRPIVVAALLLATPAIAAAQHHLNRTGTSGFAVEVIHPSYDGFETAITSAAYFLSAHTELKPGTRFLIELPVAYRAEGQDGLAGNAAMGNPYVGVQIEQRNATFEAGLRVPISGDNSASVVGFNADMIDRFEAFLTDVLSVRAGVQLHTAPLRGGVAGFDLAPVLWIPTGGDGFDAEVLVGYGAAVGYRDPAVRIMARLGGRALLTADGGSLADRTLHQIMLAGDFGSGRVRPGLYVAFPLDDDTREEISAALGLTVQITLGD